MSERKAMERSAVFREKSVTKVSSPEQLNDYKSVLTFARKRLADAESAIAFVLLTTVISALTGIIGAGFSRVFLDRLMEFFAQRRAGDIQGRQIDNEAIAGDLVNTIAPLALQTAMTVFYLVVMLRYSPLLTAVGLAALTGNVWVSGIISAKEVNATRVMMRDSGNLSAAMVSGIEMIETIKSGGAENSYFEKWFGYQASVNTQTVRFQRIN